MACDFSIIDAHAHVIPRVSGRNRFGALVSDRWGNVLRGNARLPMLPPSCASSSFPVEALVELMDREGVGQAVLLQNPTLGTCNEYVRECVERYPTWFCGTIQVDPRAPDAADVIRGFASPKQNTLKLELSFDWGWTGLYPDLRIDEPGMRPLWVAVAQLGMEVIIDPGPPGNPGYQVEAIDALTSQMPSTRFVLEHLGYPLADQQANEDAAARRRELLELARKPNVWLGLSAVPVLLQEPYPCLRSTALVCEAVERVGPRKLLWGSDVPVTLNGHTYRQLIDTILCQDGVLSDGDKRRILHDNAREVFKGLRIEPAGNRPDNSSRERGKVNKLEYVKDYWAAERDKDLDRILDHFCDDAEFVSPTMRLDGRANVAEFYRGMIDGFREIDVTPVNSVESGDTIAVEYQCRLVRSNGEVRQARGFNLFEFKDGRFRRVHCYFNPADF